MLKIKLKEKISIDGVLVDEITIREPKVKDLIAISKSKESEYEKEVALIANLAEISPQDVANMSIKDYTKVQEVLKDFLAASE